MFIQVFENMLKILALIHHQLDAGVIPLKSMELHKCQTELGNQAQCSGWPENKNSFS